MATLTREEFDKVVDRVRVESPTFVLPNVAMDAYGDIQKFTDSMKTATYYRECGVCETDSWGEVFCPECGTRKAPRPWDGIVRCERNHATHGFRFFADVPPFPLSLSKALRCKHDTEHAEFKDKNSNLVSCVQVSRKLSVPFEAVVIAWMLCRK